MLVNVALSSSWDGRLVNNSKPPEGQNSAFQMVGYDAFGDSRDERRFNSFNFFARGDATSTAAPSSANRRWLAVVDGSTRKVLYSKLLPDNYVDLPPAEIATIRAAVNMAELPQEMGNYASWAEERIPNAALRAEDDDPDLDGISNLFEYAYGTDPAAADSEKGPRLVIEGDLIKLRYQRSVDAQVTPLLFIGGDSPDATATFETGDNIEISDPVDGVEQVTITLPASPNGRFFLRLTTSTL